MEYHKNRAKFHNSRKNKGFILSRRQKHQTLDVTGLIMTNDYFVTSFESNLLVVHYLPDKT
jgi:hypothetical protein